MTTDWCACQNTASRSRALRGATPSVIVKQSVPLCYIAAVGRCADWLDKGDAGGVVGGQELLQRSSKFEVSTNNSNAR